MSDGDFLYDDGKVAVSYRPKNISKFVLEIERDKSTSVEFYLSAEDVDTIAKAKKGELEEKIDLVNYLILPEMKKSGVSVEDIKKAFDVAYLNKRQNNLS